MTAPTGRHPGPDAGSSSLIAPRLETERLILREQRAEDFARQAAMLSDPVVTRHLGGTPLSREEAWRRMLASAGLWPVLGYGYWAVERKSDGLYIGLAGFADFKRDMQPSIEGLPEMGWIFSADVHGQGYAREAVAAGLGWADRALAGQEIVAIIAPDNEPSLQLAERSGFSIREDATYKGEPIALLRRPASGN